MKNRRLFGYLAVILISIFLLFQHNNATASKIRDDAIVKKCLNFLTFAAVELAEKTSPEKPILTYIIAMNDIMYDSKDNICMANILARTIISQDKGFYGVFHIHFTPYFGKDGVWIPTAKIETYSEDWKPLLDIKEAKAKWCELINLVYSSEADEQGCR